MKKDWTALEKLRKLGQNETQNTSKSLSEEEMKLCKSFFKDLIAKVIPKTFIKYLTWNNWTVFKK